jgi:hypothetical protein
MTVKNNKIQGIIFLSLKKYAIKNKDTDAKYGEYLTFICQSDKEEVIIDNNVIKTKLAIAIIFKKPSFEIIRTSVT